jgi:hypothetical protein
MLKLKGKSENLKAAHLSKITSKWWMKKRSLRNVERVGVIKNVKITIGNNK